ncbi:MAG: ATP-dependent Clp protease ATP-binding subunit, partial [Rikenellaceae bacterium]
MQNTKTSKSLSAVIASATFAAMKLNATRSFEDILFLEMISRRDTLCYQLLSERINLVQIQQIEVQIRRVVSLPHAPTELSIGGVTPEIYYRDLISALAARYSESPRLSTLHALHFIVNDYNTIASRKLAMMGLAPKVIDRLIEEYNRDNLLSPSDSSPPRGSLALDLAPTPAPHPLSKFGVELTLLAQRGEIDPVVGRDGETQRVVEILSRRKKNNPILIGEAGVGKSAIIEGLALRIASGDVPDSIRGKRLFSLDISALVAGTKFRGEFEERMQQLLIALTSSRDAIVFIDEIHTIVGAGSTQGSLDTANILKPALARGEIQTIGATTLDEYRTHIEVDSALDRRFQRILVNPTSIEQSIEILQRIAPSYEEHHRVIYSDDALKACVTLSDRYIGDRHLPDKAIDIMDEAGARANISIPSGKQPVKVIERADIEAVITAVTGVPTERLCDDEITRLRDLEGYLARRVVGQRRAVEKLSRTIRRSRTGLRDEQRPIGVFMFVGPTGVGKTLLAKELSKWMFGEQSRNLIRIDMSEYGQSHNVARLIGSPPGYVGYGEGGELSEAVRRNPYSVVLFDEIEKAHP